MSALHTDLDIEQGSTFVLEFQIFDDQLTAVDLLTVSYDETGTKTYNIEDFSARMKIKKSKYRDTILYTCGLTGNFVTQPTSTQGFVQDGIFFMGGNTGFARLVITAATTATFKYGKHFYDVELVENIGSDEVVTKILKGVLNISAESTK